MFLICSVSNGFWYQAKKLEVKEAAKGLKERLQKSDAGIQIEASKDIDSSKTMNR